MFNFIKYKLETKKYHKKWREKNKNNFTTPAGMPNMEQIDIGKMTYGEIRVYINGNESKLEIGNFCSIGPNVSFFVSSEHPLNHLSTYPFKSIALKQGPEATSKGNIVLKDDVWVGANSTILSGVTLNQGAVVAAGAVVTNDVPPYAIVGGVPAKVIKYRFDQSTIEELLKIDFSKLSESKIKDNIDLLYSEIDSETLETLKEKIFD